jgi:RHS repeat-associated protein
VEQVSLANSTPSYMTYTSSDSSWLITNATGDETAFYGYDAFGNLAFGTPASPFGYDGQYTDPSTGFSDLRARWYAPQTGEFTSRDPAFTSTDTAYTYAGDDPVNETDPSGNFGCGFLWLFNCPSKPRKAPPPTNRHKTTPCPTTTSPTTTLPPPVPYNYPDGSNAQTAWIYLTDNLPGLWGFQVAALIGNFMEESIGVNPTQGQIGGGGGYGIAQWGSTRWNNALTYAHTINASDPASSLEFQLAFVVHELNTDYSGAFSDLVATNNIDDATAEVMNEYEEPYIPDEHLDWRQQDALWALYEYSYLTA